MHIAIGFLLAVVIAWFARRYGALSDSGALAAAIVGGVVFGFGGLAWASVLLTFFLSSTVLSRLFAGRKRQLSEKFAKDSRRDAGQVLANGGVGMLLVLAHHFLGGSSWVWVAFAGAFAAVNADTWGTELGVLSRSKPCLITSWKPVERGTSGGISLVGTVASLGGSALIALVASGWGFVAGWLPLSGILSLAGLLGSLFDSWLGASIQGIYYCPACEKETERYPQHLCGEVTRHVRGWRWLNNDWVNFLSSLVGALVALGLWLLVS
jgi:uncharacterized protein (TIGR00297 family)